MFEKLKKRLAEIAALLRALNEKCLGENGVIRKFSEDEQTEYDKLIAERSDVSGAIQRLIAEKAAEDELRALNTANPPPRIDIVREEHHNEEGEFRGFKCLGEQLQALGKDPECREDEKLKTMRLITLRAAAGMNESVESQGGILVQTDFTDGMIQSSFDASQVASLCQIHPVSNPSNAVEFPVLKETSRAKGSRNGGIQTYWVGSGGAITDSKPELEARRLKLEKLGAITYVTNEMLDDIAFLESWVTGLYVDETGFELDDAVVEGDGAGKPLGFSKAGGLLSVAKVASQTADTIVAGNVLSMFSAMIPRGRREAVWLVNPFAEAQLPGMTIGNQPVYLPPGGLTGNQFGVLMGRPVIPCESCEKLGDAGDMYFAWLKKYILLRKNGVKSASSIHVKFTTDELAYRFITRVNGEPIHKNTITPLKGNTADKFAAYVTTEARA